MLQPWTGIFNTLNFVKYQRPRLGEPNRASPLDPNSCLVVATGTTYSQLSLGLGTIHPNCRVSHYGFTNNNATEGWLNQDWVNFTEASPRNRDEGINLNFLFDSMVRGRAWCKRSRGRTLFIDTVETAL